MRIEICLVCPAVVFKCCGECDGRLSGWLDEGNKMRRGWGWNGMVQSV